MNPIVVNVGAVALTAIGCLQMAGDVSGVIALKALGAASHASPAPRVFTAHQGFETFSSRFYIEWTDTDGNSQQLQLTPASYAGISGPYNRRNAYGAALSYGPVLSRSEATEPMFQQVSRYALCGDSALLRELGIAANTISGVVTVRLEPRQPDISTGNWQLSFSPDCDRSDAS